MPLRLKATARLLGCSFLGLLLFGCGGADVTTTGAINPKIEKISRDKSTRGFVAASNPATGKDISSTATGFGIIRDARMEAYLQKIVGRLMQHWHGDKPDRVGVFVASGDGIRAHATPSGDILIPIGAFESFENEDQLAVLIGHELGHIVLKHFDDERQARELAQLGEVLVTGVMGVSSVRNGEMVSYGNRREFRITRPGAVQQDTARALMIHVGVVTVTQDIILTAYSREQEYAADVFGATLAGSAGWDWMALRGLLSKWEAAEKERLKQQEADLLQSANLMEGVKKGVGQILAPIVASHPDAESRGEHVSKEVPADLRDATPPKPTAAPLKQAVNEPGFARKRSVWRDINKASVLYKKGQYAEATAIIRAVMNQPDAAHPESRMIMSLAVAAKGTPDAAREAYRLISSADLRQPATLEVYQQFALEHAEHSNWPMAEQVIAVGEKYYGERMLPTRIDLVRLQMKRHDMPPQHLVEAMDQLKDRCRASKSEELIEGCKLAARGEDPNGAHRTCGGILSGLVNESDQKSCYGSQAKESNALGSAVGGLLRGVPGLAN